MSDALTLPPHPNIEQYKKLAKDLQTACKSGDPDAVRAWALRWITTIARLLGDLTIERQQHIAIEAERMDQRWRKHQQTNQRAARCTLANAQCFVAREHGFASWPRLVRHLEALALPKSSVSNFEAAADAVVNGDLAALEKLLQENPGLVNDRSTREHRSTLLHYVSANGVEDFRQKTPKNIVEIAALLLKTGADANAESDAYGGRSTTLGLTATSWHPENAGVQYPLMELLIAHGAVIDGPDGGSEVNGCLQNGRGEAAEFFARHGARLDLEGAAGVGRLDVVRSFFNHDGSLKASATPQQMKDGFAWACQFGRTDVVEFFLRMGVHADEKLKHDGQTGLHWAAYGGYPDTVDLLLQRGAKVDAKDESYGGTPLGWALYAWGSSSEGVEPQSTGSGGQYYKVVALLVRAGAKLDPQWYEDDEERRRAAAKIKSDLRMLAALRALENP